MARSHKLIQTNQDPPAPLPSPLRPPSSRDLEIYSRVCIRNVPRWEVAHDFAIDRSRVSQIIRRVRRWLAAGGSPTDPQLQDQFAQRRLSRGLYKLRLHRALEIAAAHLETGGQPLIKTRRRVVGGTEVWREEIEAERPQGNLYALQQFVAAAKALDALESSADNEQPPDSLSPTPDILPSLVELLCQFRAKAEADGHVEPTTDVHQVVVHNLVMLLGNTIFPDKTILNEQPRARSLCQDVPPEPALASLTPAQTAPDLSAQENCPAVATHAASTTSSESN